MINLILAIVTRQFDQGVCGIFINNTSMMITCNKTKLAINFIPYLKKSSTWTVDCNLGTKIK